MRRARGISNTVATALLIVVAIALAVSIYFVSQRFTGASDFVQVQAFKIQNSYVSNNQIAVVGLRMIPKSDKYLTISSIRITVTDANGNTDTIEWTPSANLPLTGTNTGVQLVSVEGPTTINPGSTVELTFTFKQDISTNAQIVSVAFQVVLQDPSGAQYSFSSNEVTLT